MSNDFVKADNRATQVADATKPRRPSNIWLIIVAAAFIIVPFLTWYFTWFGRPLSDEKIAEYLADESKPRNIQHALTQIEARIEKNDPSARKFYPRILELAKSPSTEVRKTTAWVMGQDNKSEDFHRALIELLNDPEPLVRRNAALQLVRFTDANGKPDGSGRAELRAMLQPFEAKSPINGTIVSILPVGSELRAGALLARIRPTDPKSGAPGDVQELRAPVDGTISFAPGASMPAANEGDQLAANQTIAWLNPDRATVIAALRALVYVGTKDDLALIESAAKSDGSDVAAQEAAQTSKAIRARFQAQ